jgi:hypothetical protein
MLFFDFRSFIRADIDFLCNCNDIVQLQFKKLYTLVLKLQILYIFVNHFIKNYLPFFMCDCIFCVQMDLSFCTYI